jgi:hypothetical protein
MCPPPPRCRCRAQNSTREGLRPLPCLVQRPRRAPADLRELPPRWCPRSPSLVAGLDPLLASLQRLRCPGPPPVRAPRRRWRAGGSSPQGLRRPPVPPERALQGGLGLQQPPARRPRLPPPPSAAFCVGGPPWHSLASPLRLLGQAFPRRRRSPQSVACLSPQSSVIPSQAGAPAVTLARCGSSTPSPRPRARHGPPL